MATATVQDLACFEARLSVPRAGVWCLDAVVNTRQALSGAVSAKVGKIDLTGTVAHGEVYLDALRVRIVGGMGGMGKTASPKFWQQTAAQQVASSLLDSVGESLDSASSLSASLAFWAVGSGTAGAELGKLAAALSDATVWRVQPGGKVWVGEDSWADSGVSGVEIDRDPIERVVVIGADVPALLPGTTWEGLRIDLVEHHVKAGAVRTLAWWTA